MNGDSDEAEEGGRAMRGLLKWENWQCFSTGETIFMDK